MSIFNNPLQEKHQLGLKTLRFVRYIEDGVYKYDQKWIVFVRVIEPRRSKVQISSNVEYATPYVDPLVMLMQKPYGRNKGEGASNPNLVTGEMGLHLPWFVIHMHVLREDLMTREMIKWKIGAIVIFPKSEHRRLSRRRCNHFLWLRQLLGTPTSTLSFNVMRLEIYSDSPKLSQRLCFICPFSSKDPRVTQAFLFQWLLLKSFSVHLSLCCLRNWLLLS
ncbi:hypothetical protein L6452_42645 [Arctium lappa]|uniref:Uncharacterized protein n=1 Tax=Arctium lappa TaxID=4217 RepID=A0ACB8XIT8_ARCLA|nr:hypothetical protein L6452_42645 [Arctium lappa]